MIEVERKTVEIRVRGQCYVLEAMGGRQLLEWGELQILLGQELCGAHAKARVGMDVKGVVETLLMGNVALVCRATGAPAAEVETWSWEERSSVLKVQDRLNGVDKLLPFLDGFAQRSWLDGQ